MDSPTKTGYKQNITAFKFLTGKSPKKTTTVELIQRGTYIELVVRDPKKVAFGKVVELDPSTIEQYMKLQAQWQALQHRLESVYNN